MSSQQSVTKFVEPIKSATDERLYRHLTLPNKLEVLLVSDPETDKSAAALDVRVGHFSDPEVAPGLAHFCEHMLFLGTKKYPDENSYSAYLNAHGGYSNAFTAVEDTNYYFEVNHEHLEGALDRFAQFFLEPLFTASATDREMQAVHNENAKNLQNDVWRHYQLLKSTANPAHPFSKFGTGNLKTLKEDPIAKGVDIRKELLKFHETYYSANIMKLCIVGREPLDTLQQWAVDKFSGVRNTNIPAPVPSVPAFTPDQLANVVHVVPVKDLRSVYFLWPMKETFSVYRHSPTSVLSHLLGHEAEGSILARLKEKGWASSLSAGANHSSLNFSVFSVSIDLTPEGLAHVSDITQIMYQYITLLNQASGERYHEIWAEERDVHAMNFRFKSKENVSDYASHLVGNMQTYTPEHTLCGGSLFHEFSEKHIREYLSFLRPDNMRVHVISQSFKGQTKKEEQWYGTYYDVRPLSQQELQACKNPGSNPGLFLPKKNEFIASDFTLKVGPKIVTEEEKNAAPVLLLNNPQARVWFKLDKKFLKPKANVWMIIASPEAYSSPAAAVLTDLYCKLLEDSLNEYAYDAEIAGLAYSLTPTVTGLKLSFSGYNHKLAVLLGKVVERMRTLVIKPDRFARIKEKVTRALKNWELEAPYSHAIYHASNAVEIGRWHHREKLEVMDACTPEALAAHIQALLSKMHMELLAHGNLLESECMDVVKMIVSTTPISGIPASQIPEERIANLPFGYTYLIHERARNPSDVNSAIQITYQIGEDTVRTHALLEVMAHLAVEKAYHQLRTIEQLGYLVWSGLSEARGVLNYRVIVQSSNRAPSYLDERVESFLHQFRDMLVKMPEEEYQESVAGAVAKKLEKDQKLRDETEKHWAEIGRHRYMFGRVNLEANEMKAIKKSEIIDFYDQFIKCGSSQRRKMTSQIVGNIHDIEADRKTFLGQRPVTVNRIAGPGVAAPAFDFKPVHDITHIPPAAPVVVHPKPAVVAGAAGPAASPPLEPKPEAEAPPVQDEVEEADAADEDGKVAEECEQPSPAPEQIVLLPAPVDSTPVVHITDFPKFRRSVPLYPVLV